MFGDVAELQADISFLIYRLRSCQVWGAESKLGNTLDTSKCRLETNDLETNDVRMLIRAPKKTNCKLWSVDFSQLTNSDPEIVKLPSPTHRRTEDHCLPK